MVGSTLTNIRHKEPQKHLVLVDTNILWTEDKKIVVAQEFLNFWDGHASMFALKLCLPSVVRGELIFQRTSSLKKALRKVENEFDIICSLTDKSYRHRLKPEILQKNIAARIDNWVRSVRGVFVDVPIETINWKDLIDDAIWHRKPFSDDPNKRDLEKGFKDKLILETVINVCQENDDQYKIVFLSNDSLLRDTAYFNLSKERNFSTFESISEFEGYLRLTEESLTSEFIIAIQRKAASKFFAPNKDDSLLYREKVIQHIQKEYSENFRMSETVSQPSILPGGLLNWQERGSGWQKEGDEGIWVSRSKFDKLEGERLFHWKANITFLQLFRRVQLTTTLLSSHTDSLQLLRFEVTWCVMITNTGRFYKPHVEDISLVKSSFEPPTPEQVRDYRLYTTDSNNEE